MGIMSKRPLVIKHAPSYRIGERPDGPIYIKYEYKERPIIKIIRKGLKL